jgi:hypothetical protein
MRINWFVTTALAALLGSGAVLAQSNEPPGRQEKAAPQAQPERAKQAPAPNAQRPEGHADTKAKGREPGPTAQGAEDQAKDAKARRAQGNEPAGRNPLSERKGAQATEPPNGQGTQEKRAGESKQPGAQRGPETRNAREDLGKQKSQEKGQAKNPQSAQEKSPQSSQGKAQQNAQEKAQQSPAEKGQPKGQAKAPEQGQPAGQARGAAQTKQNGQSQGAAQSNQGRDNAKNATTTNERNNAAAQSPREPSAGQNTASTKISEADRGKIISSLRSDRSVSREQQLNIHVNIGERLPPRVRPRPLPREIVEITPEYRGYEYVMLQDEVVIVRPGTREVVDIIREPSASSARSETRESTSIRLSDEQRGILLREARPMTSAQVASPGSSCLPMQPVPESLASQNPDLRNYQYIAIGNEVVLVDPKEQKIVDVIRQ